MSVGILPVVQVPKILDAYAQMARSLSRSVRQRELITFPDKQEFIGPHIKYSWASLVCRCFLPVPYSFSLTRGA